MYVFVMCERRNWLLRKGFNDFLYLRKHHPSLKWNLFINFISVCLTLNSLRFENSLESRRSGGVYKIPIT